MSNFIPLISSSVAGPLGVLHLPRLWLKASLIAAGKGHPDYPICNGYDSMVLGALGLDKDEFVKFIADSKPTYPQLETWILEKSGGKLDADAVKTLNGSIAGYNHDDATRTAILSASGIPDDGSLPGALILNNLDDWQTFHKEVLS